MKIILIGMKACGKSTVGKLLAGKLGVQFIELDNELEKRHNRLQKENLNFREIYKKYGNEYFRNLETKTLKKISKRFMNNNYILAWGGGTPLNNKNREILKKMGTIIYLEVNKNVLLARILKDGIPTFFPYPEDPNKSLNKLMKKRIPLYESLSNKTVKIYRDKPAEIVSKINNYLISISRPRNS